MFSPKDLEQIRSKGIEIQSINRQLEFFHKGFPFVRLEGPATPGNGILTLSPGQKDFYISYFEQHMGRCQVMKFVPASGAASRMFKHLFEFRSGFDGSDQAWKEFTGDTSFNSVWNAIQHLQNFAFYEDLVSVPGLKGRSVQDLFRSREIGTLIDSILNEEGLNYAALPKALLKFHRYPEGSRTAMEEHLVEAAGYVRDDKGISRIHFTVSPEHKEKLSERALKVRDIYEKRFGVRLEIGYSIQKASTDTLAVNERNEPFRNNDGSLLFRPAGHGALLQNLEEAGEEIVFIKNIDNIVPDRLKQETFDYKMALGGYLLWVREPIFEWLSRSETGEQDPGETLKIQQFATENLMIRFPEEYSGLPETGKRKILRELLDRPIRVCGMVKNVGEPGGGPYWVSANDGRSSLQVVESSQVDMKDPKQKTIFSQATHFNPVDLVCSIRDYKGNKFSLEKFVDEDTGFISLKSSGGQVLKAQELPGLWNGAMAKWITVFVEVPILTFNPVKTINDLLRKEHQ